MRDLNAESVMVKPVVRTREDAPAKDVALMLLGGHYTGMPVTDSEEKVVGVITEFDLLKALMEGKDLSRISAKDVMTKGAVTADVSTTVSKLTSIMTEMNILRLPITRDGRLVGIVARPDILRSQLDPELFIL